MSEAELARAVKADAPELRNLLADFQETMAEATERLQPLLASARQRKLTAGEGGLNVLRVKLQLMLSYCTNISFYLLLKAQGKPVRSHPVVDALLRNRTLLERLRPLEQKLSYRLNKLLQLASSAEAGGITDHQADLAERPNPDSLLAKAGGVRAAAAEGEEGEEGDEEGDGLYRPPKMSAVHYDDEVGSSSKKAERQRERAVARASSTRMVRELRRELSEAPESIHADDFGGALDADTQAVARFRKEEDERRVYEESNFKRLQMTKLEKRAHAKKAAAASGAAVDELGTFDDFSHLYDTATSQATDAREEKRKALQQYMDSMEQRGKKQRRGRGNDDDDDDLYADDGGGRGGNGRGDDGGRGGKRGGGGKKRRR